jgi:hypothetical protein
MNATHILFARIAFILLLLALPSSPGGSVFAQTPSLTIGLNSSSGKAGAILDGVGRDQGSDPTTTSLSDHYSGTYTTAVIGANYGSITESESSIAPGGGDRFGP